MSNAERNELLEAFVAASVALSRLEDKSDQLAASVLGLQVQMQRAHAILLRSVQNHPACEE